MSKQHTTDEINQAWATVQDVINKADLWSDKRHEAEKALGVLLSAAQKHAEAPQVKAQLSQAIHGMDWVSPYIGDRQSRQIFERNAVRARALVDNL